MMTQKKLPSERLADLIKAEGIKHAEFAVRAGVTKWQLSRILNGQTPSGPTAAKIERATGGVIRASSWYSEEAA